jgi:hypothetical protein
MEAHMPLSEKAQQNLAMRFPGMASTLPQTDP